MLIKRRKVVLIISVLLSLYVLSFLLLPVELQVYFDKSTITPPEALHLLPVFHGAVGVVDLDKRLKDLQMEVGRDQVQEWLGHDFGLVENKFRLETKTLNIIAIFYDLKNRNGIGNKSIFDVRFTFISIPAVNDEFYTFFYKPLASLQGKLVGR